MIRLQWLTGMRSAEVCQMRGCDIETTCAEWLYRPARHKTQHHGHERLIYLGPKTKEIVERHLKPDLQAYLFSPRDAEAARREQLHAARKTPPKQGNAPGTNRVKRPKREPGERYRVRVYRRSIARACEIAFVMPADVREPTTKAAKAAEAAIPAAEQKQRKAQRRAARSAWRREHVWHPHQLRHSAGTRLRKEYGLEAAQVILGHKTLKITELYAEK